ALSTNVRRLDASELIPNDVSARCSRSRSLTDPGSRQTRIAKRCEREHLEAAAPFRQRTSRRSAPAFAVDKFAVEPLLWLTSSLEQEHVAARAATRNVMSCCRGSIDWLSSPMKSSEIRTHCPACGHER